MPWWRLFFCFCRTVKCNARISHHFNGCIPEIKVMQQKFLFYSFSNPISRLIIKKAFQCASLFIYFSVLSTWSSWSIMCKKVVLDNTLNRKKKGITLFKMYYVSKEHSLLGNFCQKGYDGTNQYYYLHQLDSTY